MPVMSQYNFSHINQNSCNKCFWKEKIKRTSNTRKNDNQQKCLFVALKMKNNIATLGYSISAYYKETKHSSIM